MTEQVRDQKEIDRDGKKITTETIYHVEYTLLLYFKSYIERVVAFIFGFFPKMTGEHSKNKNPFSYKCVTLRTLKAAFYLIYLFPLIMSAMVRGKAYLTRAAWKRKIGGRGSFDYWNVL